MFHVQTASTFARSAVFHKNYVLAQLNVEVIVLQLFQPINLHEASSKSHYFVLPRGKCLLWLLPTRSSFMRSAFATNVKAPDIVEVRISRIASVG
jgi:hypothetical protein